MESIREVDKDLLDGGNGKGKRGTTCWRGKAREVMSSILRSRASWALIDQGVVSAGNCATSVVIARYAPVAIYGTYALLSGIIISAISIQIGVVGYPITIIGGSGTEADGEMLVGDATIISVGLILVGLVVVAIGGQCAGRPDAIPSACAALAWGLLQTVTRFGLFSKLRFREAVVGDGISYVGQAVLLALAGRGKGLTLEHVFWVIALTSCCAFIVQTVQIGSSFRTSTRRIMARWRQFWKLGRWVLVSTCLGNVAGQMLPWTLQLRFGAESVGGLSALSNIGAATNPIVFGIGNVTVPAVARARSRSGIGAAWRTAFTYGLVGLCVIMPYLASIIVVPRWLLHIWYGSNTYYTSLVTPLRVYAVACITTYCAQLTGCFLNGCGRSQDAARGSGVSAVVGVIVGVPVVVMWGMLGAVCGLFLVALSATCAFVVLSIRMVRKDLLRTHRLSDEYLLETR